MTIDDIANELSIRCRRNKEVNHMKKAILATKVGMTQIFKEDGSLVPVTVLQAGPCVVTQIKTVENDGYSAVQVGFVDKKEKVVNKDKNGNKTIYHRHGATKAEQGHFKKAGVSCKRFVREFKFENAAEYELGAEIKADIFDLWHTVPSSTVIRVLMVQVQILAAYLRARECLVTWEVLRLQFRILRL